MPGASSNGWKNHAVPDPREPSANALSEPMTSVSLPKLVVMPRFESGAFYAHLRRCRRHYAERQGFFLEQVKRSGLPLHFPVSGRGMNLAGLLPQGTHDAALSARLKEQGLDVPPLKRYAINPVPPGLLFGLSAFNKRQIQEGIETMVRIIEKLDDPLSN